MVDQLVPAAGAAQPNWPLDNWTKFEPLQVVRPAPYRFVEEAVVAKKLVVVAEVAVAFPVIVKLPTLVEEELEMKPPVRVARLATARVPVKLADEEMVWPFTRPEVRAPRVELPAFKAVA